MARPPASRHAHLPRRPHVLAGRGAAILLAALTLSAPAPAIAQADDPLGLRLDVRGSPMRSDGSGRGIRARVRLAAPARLRLLVTDFDGRTVRELFEGERRAGTLVRSWRGRDEQGDLVAPGPYRVVAVTSSAGGSMEAPAAAMAWVTVADRPVYSAAPGSITVAIDPGHGPTYEGAIADDGTREADLNLDIGLRLARMLQGARVDVVLTRSTDDDANTPPVDRTRDGVIDETDELASRPDIANAARADVFIAVHNNIAVNAWVGGPSTYYSDERPFADRSRRLARHTQDRMVANLDAVVGGSWQPYDHGTLTYPYYVLRDYDPPRLLRPTQMPGVLSEGLFLSNPRELRLLKQRRVRQAMANAYYEAVGQYLAGRGHHVGYSLEDGPTEVPPATRLELLIEVRNQGTRPMRGWRLTAGALRAGSAAVGRAGPGVEVGKRRIPPLAPGEARTLRLPVRAPTQAGAWTLMVDALDARGRRASRSGSPMLQVPLTTVTGPPASASPQSVASARPQSVASASPHVAASDEAP